MPEAASARYHRNFNGRALVSGLCHAQRSRKCAGHTSCLMTSCSDDPKSFQSENHQLNRNREQQNPEHDFRDD